MLDSYVKKALQAVHVSEVPGISRWRVGNPNGDGGYVVAKELMIPSKTDLFSFGIGDEFSFELFVSPFFRSVMMFDTQSCVLEKKTPNMFFSPIPFSTGVLKSFKIPFGSMLKFDVEGNEWDILLYCLEHGELDNFTQIIGEFHLFPIQYYVGIDRHSPYFSRVFQDFYSKINEKVFELYYKVFSLLHEQFFCFHVHANNSLPYCIVDGFRYPPLLELSFVRKDCVCSKFVSSSKTYFPIMDLDVPNKADRPDFRDVYPLYKEGEIC